MRLHPCIAALALLTLTVSGCGPFGNTGPAEDPLVSALRASYTAHSVDAVIEALADSGIGVYSTTDDSTPVRQVKPPAVPLKLLRWQARSLALDVTTPGAGVTGDDLDSLGPVPDGYLPTSYLLAAYVKSGITPGAKLARALMGNLDWVHPSSISFPTLVLIFLVSDTARAEQQGVTPSGQPAASVLRSTRTSGIGSLCSTLVNWVDEVFDSLFNLLTVPPSSNGVLNFLGSIWNTGIALVEKALKAVINALTAKVVAVIRLIIATIGLAADAVSLLQNVKVKLTANPTFNHYSNNPGTVTATLGDPDGADWPQALQECLVAFGVPPLPSLTGANHDPVTWTFTPTPPFAAVLISKQANLDSRNSARLDYVTGNDDHPCSPAPDDMLQVDVDVHLLAIDNLKQFVVGLFSSVIGLPDPVKSIVQPELDNLILGVLGKLAAIIEPHDRRFVLIEHRVPPPPACMTPTPSFSASPSGSPVPFGIGDCDQLIYPGDTIAPVVDPSARAAGGIFDLNCPIGDPTDESLAKGFVVYYRYPSAFGAQELMDELLASGASPVTGVGDQAVVIPNCQRMVGATPNPASCAVARLCNQVVEARIQGQDALALVRLILHRLPTACATNPTPSIPPSPLPTPLPPTPPPSPTPTPS